MDKRTASTWPSKVQKEELRGVAEKFGSVAADLLRMPPCHNPPPAPSCVVSLQEKDKRARKKRGFHGLDPREMCDSCAAYWHATCGWARLFLALKRIEIFEEEEDKK